MGISLDLFNVFGRHKCYLCVNDYIMSMITTEIEVGERPAITVPIIETWEEPWQTIQPTSKPEH